jgi:hypothetical protein
MLAAASQTYFRLVVLTNRDSQNDKPANPLTYFDRISKSNTGLFVLAVISRVWLHRARLAA